MRPFFQWRRSVLGSLSGGLMAGLFMAVLLRAGLPGSGKMALIPDRARVGYEAIDARHLKAIVTFLASRHLEGRAATERGARIAAAFLETQLTLAGLHPPPGQTSMLQKFNILKSTINPASSISIFRGEALLDSFVIYEDFYLLFRGSQSLIEEGPVVFAGFGIRDLENGIDDYRGLSVRNRVVLVLSGIPDHFRQPKDASRPFRSESLSRRVKINAAKKLGARALVIVSEQSILDMVVRFKRWFERPKYALLEGDSTMPVIIVSRDMAETVFRTAGLTYEEVKSRLRRGAGPGSFRFEDVSFRFQIEIDNEIREAQNVIAYLPGSDERLKDQIVAFGAHYDHLGIARRTIRNIHFPGADDNASGTAAVLEIARAFATNPWRPGRSLLFIFHTAEERGLLGSRYFTSSPVIPLKRFMAMINIDMVGRNDEDAIYVIGSNFHSMELHRINEQNSRILGLRPDYTYNSLDDPNRFYYRSDHYHYARHGIPIIFYFSGTHEDYHSIRDRVNKLNFTKIEKVARLAYLTGWTLSNLPHRLKRDGILVQPDEP